MGSSATGPRPGRLLLLYGGVVFLLFVAVPAGVYFAVDPEKLDIDQSVRDQRARAVRAPERRLHALRDRRAGGRPRRRPRGRRHRAVLHLGSDVLRARRRRISRASGTTTTVAAIPTARTFPTRRISTSGSSPSCSTRCISRSRSISRGSPLAGRSSPASPIAIPRRFDRCLYFDPAFRSPQTLSPLESMPRVWSFVTAIMNERWWADGQLRRLPVPGAISRLARTLSRAAAVPRIPPRPSLGPGGQRHRRSA